MTDTQETDSRSRAGTPADRAPAPARIANTAAYGLSAGLGLASVHWVLKSYHPGSGWDWQTPDDALIEMWIVTLLPTVHLLGRIVNNHLKKLAGEENTP